MEQGRAFLEQPEQQLCRAIRHSPAKDSELAALVLRVLEGGALSCPVRTRSPPNLEKAGELSGKKIDELREILKGKGLSTRGRKALLIERIVAAGS